MHTFFHLLAHHSFILSKSDILSNNSTQGATCLQVHCVVDGILAMPHSTLCSFSLSCFVCFCVRVPVHGSRDTWVLQRFQCCHGHTSSLRIPQVRHRWVKYLFGKACFCCYPNPFLFYPFFTKYDNKIYFFELTMCHVYKILFFFVCCVFLCSDKMCFALR